MTNDATRNSVSLNQDKATAKMFEKLWDHQRGFMTDDLKDWVTRLYLRHILRAKKQSIDELATFGPDPNDDIVLLQNKLADKKKLGELRFKKFWQTVKKHSQLGAVYSDDDIKWLIAVDTEYRGKASSVFLKAVMGEDDWMQKLYEEYKIEQGDDLVFTIWRSKKPRRLWQLVAIAIYMARLWVYAKLSAPKEAEPDYSDKQSGPSEENFLAQAN